MKALGVVVFMVALAWLARKEGYRVGFDDGLDASPAIVADRLQREQREEDLWTGMVCDRSDREVMCDRIIEIVEGGILPHDFRDPGMFDDLIAD